MTVVDIREIEPGVAQVTMQDRANKNALSEDLVVALHQAFATIAADAR